MKDNFGVALKRVLVYEGGLVDHPKDPGGKTNQGITQRVYAAYRSRRGLPARDVSKLEPRERDTIYQEQYWEPLKGDSLPGGLDLCLFDGAVHSGVSQSVKWLQRALGVVVDGQIGQVTLDRIETHPDIDALIADICHRRLLFCRALKTWGPFGKGWSARISSLQMTAQAMAVGSVGPASIYAAGSERKALLSDAKHAPQTIAADAGAGGGFSVSGTLAIVKDQLSELSGMSATLDQWLGYLTALGVVVGIGAGAYAYWARERAKVLADRLDTKPMQLVAPAAVGETDVPSA